MSKPIFAAIRASRITNLGQMKQIEAHGKRLDDASAKRVDAERTPKNLIGSPYSLFKPLELVDAFKALKAATGASEGQGRAALGLHVLAVISPELIAEAGNPHDPDNPVNQKIWKESRIWAEKAFGKGSLIAARMDMDEAGSGVVDLIVCPTTMQSGGRRKKEKLTISVNSALKRLQEEYGTTRNFEALQTSWADHARTTIDERIERGSPKKETGRDHVHADVIRPALDELRLQREALEVKANELRAKEIELQKRSEWQAGWDVLFEDSKARAAEKLRFVEEREAFAKKAAKEAQQMVRQAEKSAKLSSATPDQRRESPEFRRAAEHFVDADKEAKAFEKRLDQAVGTLPKEDTAAWKQALGQSWQATATVFREEASKWLASGKKPHLDNAVQAIGSFRSWLSGAVAGFVARLRSEDRDQLKGPD